MIKVSDTEFTQYAIKIEDFKELIQSDSKNTYKYAHNLISELMSNPLKIGDEQFNWVSYGKYRKGENIIVFEIHRLLKPYLLEIQQNFLKYNIKNILPLRSSYVIRFYELCKDYFNEGTRYNKNKSVTFDIKIDRLRELFEIPSSYQYSSHIKKLIIEKSKKQFKAKTDIQFTYQEQKIGRKVDRLIITVKENNKGSNDFLSDLKSFIAHMRKNYVNQNVWTGQEMILSISESGRIYDKKTLREYNNKDSQKVWESWYELAKDNELLCLKQGTLF